MGSVNKAIIVGNLGRDPELRYTPSGQAVANFTVATNEQWTDKSGQKQERTEWHRIVVWGKQAENCGEYLSKGRQVFIEGRLQTREWNDKEGKRNFTTEIVADRVVFLSGDKGGAKRAPGASESFPSSGSRGAEDFGPPPPGLDDEPGRGAGAPANGKSKPVADDDIPF